MDNDRRKLTWVPAACLWAILLMALPFAGHLATAQEEAPLSRGAVILAERNGPVAFLNENILECDLSDATCAYLCCACMDAAFVESVVEALRAKARGLRKMVVVERLETKFGTDVDAVGLRLAGEHRVGQTWAPEGYPLYVYETTEAWVR